ncbi:TPA: tail assembly protein [Salmonella enterica subsp. enterica serovar Concord]|nr:tail assembly protein [Salmonella enterica subsp. enterica serovar Concord]
MATTHTLNMAAPAMARICLYGDLQRFGRRFDLSIKTGAEGIRALAVQIPGFRQKLTEGWYQIRVAGEDVSMDDVTTRLHEPLPAGAVIHIVPRMVGAKNSGLFQVVIGVVAIAASFFTAGGTLALWGAALSAGAMSATTVLFGLGMSMVLGGVAQMLTPVPKTPSMAQTDNGKQNTYFSSLDNMVAQGNPMPVPYGEMLVGSRVISQMLSTRDEDASGKVVVIGRTSPGRSAALRDTRIAQPDVIIR